MKNVLFGRPKSFVGWAIAGLIIAVFAVGGQMVGQIAGSRAFENEALEKKPPEKKVPEQELPIQVAEPQLAASKPSGKLVGFCPFTPIEERHTLTPKCQEINAKKDIADTRFNECFRLLNIAGIREGKCDTLTHRYVLNLKEKAPVVVVFDSNDKALFNILLPDSQSKNP